MKILRSTLMSLISTAASDAYDDGDPRIAALAGVGRNATRVVYGGWEHRGCRCPLSLAGIAEHDHPDYESPRCDSRDRGFYMAFDEAARDALGGDTAATIGVIEAVDTMDEDVIAALTV